jgi:nucleoside-diphosphate-sugar epimerase
MEDKTKHILLGAGGAIGNTLVNKLLANDELVKLVSRSEYNVKNTESAKADLTIFNDVENAVEENSIIYLLAGLQYNINVWREQWPKIMDNTINACKEKNARLIFFDNVYSYGKVDNSMTEETPFNPCSKKGEVRAKLNEQLLDEMKNNNITAMIARAADFYGPYSGKGSIPYILVFKNLANGKRAQCLANVKTKHSYTYVPDCGKALYLLSKTDSAFDQTWHMPTAGPALTSENFIKIVAHKLGVEPKYMLLKKWMVKLTGIFNGTIKEIYEMLYQNEFDYVFDSSKFEKQFNFTPISYEKGIEETINHYYLKK